MQSEKNRDGRDPCVIQADSVVVEVTDSKTGRVFRRSVPLAYSESENGLFLTGEDLSGNAATIVFLSDAAAGKLRDLTGKGADQPVHHGDDRHGRP